MLEDAFRCTSMERYPLYHFDAELIRADAGGNPRLESSAKSK
jgi:hypothetical protein